MTKPKRGSAGSPWSAEFPWLTVAEVRAARDRHRLQTKKFLTDVRKDPISRELAAICYYARIGIAAVERGLDA